MTPQPLVTVATGGDLPPTIAWAGDHVRLIDQRLLPSELRVIEVHTVDQLCACISTLAVRGAPALGAAGAMGVALAAVRGEPLREAAEQVRATRPTAVNLGWGIDLALAAADPITEACRIAQADVVANRAIGTHGGPLLPHGANVLTHCNAGALACVGYGTALGVIRNAHEAGNPLHVWVDETRPLFQGARITAFELQRLGIACTVLPDNASGSLFGQGLVDAVVVGADRIAANGDTANKVGTYPVAVLAHHHGVPLYVAAPWSTVDFTTLAGPGITIEQRDSSEVSSVGTGVHAQQLVPTGVAVYNPAFDVTPSNLIAAIVTETGAFPSHELGRYRP